MTNPLISQWLKKADEDFFFASTHLEDEKSFFGQICFHFHQAAEKYLKSFIVYNKLIFRKIHNLKELVQICKEKDNEFTEIEEECLYLNQFYIETRYPVHWPSSFSINDAYKAKESANKIRKFINNKLKIDIKKAFTRTNFKKNLRGFTLIELLIVIAILGMIAAFISVNFITSLKKGRDAKRKVDLNQIQKALEMYYEDKKAYPLTGELDFGGEFVDPGLSGKIYMQKVPADQSASYSYYYDSTDGTYYKLYSCIENTQDNGQGVNQEGYATSCGTNCPSCKFGVASSNELP